MSPGHGPEIRIANRGDIPELRAALAGFLGKTSAELARNGDSIDKVVAAPEHLVLVADGPPILGFITVSFRTVVRFPWPVAEIDELFVAEASRREGVARKLTDAAREAAAARGVGRLFVASNVSRHAAQSFYESMGFTRYGAHFRTTVPPDNSALRFEQPHDSLGGHLRVAEPIDHEMVDGSAGVVDELAK